MPPKKHSGNNRHQNIALFIKDLPEKKTLLDNEDVVVQISFEAETSYEIKDTLVATRKDEATYN